MTTTRYWIGSGTASDPLNWSPTGAPQPGDTLIVQPTADNPGPFTMDVASVPGGIAGSVDPINVLGGAILSAHTGGETSNLPITFNVSQGSTANMQVGPHASEDTIINLSQGSTANVTAFVSSVTMNISGNDTATLFGGDGFSATVNLDKGAMWSGTFDLATFSPLTVNGGAGSAFNNDGASFAGQGGRPFTIGADVIGTGTFQVSGESHLEFVKSVGPHQSISLTEGLVQVDKPTQFDASVSLAPGGELDLMGLAKADSYSYKNDLLNIWSDNKIIDTLRLDQAQLGFAAVKTASSVNVVALTFAGETLPGALPPHTST